MGNHRQQRGTLLRFFSKREEHANGYDLTGLLDEESFEHQLAVERMRAERSGFSFTVIVFSIDYAGGPVDQERAARALVSVLRDRTRFCDTKGWFGENMAVILPYTSRERAICLVAPLDSMFHQRLTSDPSKVTGEPRLSFAVYEYPSDELKKGETIEFDAGGIASSGG
jgi:hypothetical protein